MKGKTIFGIIGALVIVAGAVAAIVVFKDDIKAIISELKEAFCPKKWIETDEMDEFDDFADI